MQTSRAEWRQRLHGAEGSLAGSKKWDHLTRESLQNSLCQAELNPALQCAHNQDDEAAQIPMRASESTVLEDCGFSVTNGQVQETGKERRGCAC